MNRRSFLARLGLGAAGLVAAQVLEGAVLDPEKLLWVPGRKTIFLPPDKTFSLYTDADLRALQSAMGVLRFKDPHGGPRYMGFDPSPEALALLSDQEIRLAIATGYDLLAPTLASHGLVDMNLPKHRRRTVHQWTDRGMVTVIGG